MSWGVEVFASNGSVILSDLDDLARYVGLYQYTAPANGSVDVTVPGLEKNSTWWVVCGHNFTISSNNVRVYNTMNPSSVSGVLSVLRLT